MSDYGDPRQQTPEERGFQEGMRYIPPGNMDAGWHQTVSAFVPYTFNITIRTGFIVLLAWLVGMFAEKLQKGGSVWALPQGEMAVALVVWAFFWICVAGAIALPLLSLKEINWAGKIFWIYFFDQLLVSRESVGQAFMLTVVGSAVSEIVAGFWERRGTENMLTYRIPAIGRMLVFAALGAVAIHWALVSVKSYLNISSPTEEAVKDNDPLKSLRLPRKDSPDPQKPTVQPIAPPEITNPQEAPPPPVAPLPVPSREPDFRFSFNNQKAGDGPPSLSYLFNDISFESGDEPTPGMRASVLEAVQTGHIREEQRLSNTVEDERMWQSNVKLATAEATKRVQQDVARLASQGQSVNGMECRIWVLDYSLRSRGSQLFVQNARLQVDCRR